MFAPTVSRTVGQGSIPRLSCSLSRSSSSHISTRISQAISHQRRNSSSKPSSSSNGDPSHIAPVVKGASPTDSELKDSTSGSRKKPFSKLPRTKLKESSSKAEIAPAFSPNNTLPSVPSTQHLHSQGMGTSKTTNILLIHSTSRHSRCLSICVPQTNIRHHTLTYSSHRCRLFTNIFSQPRRQVASLSSDIYTGIGCTKYRERGAAIASISKANAFKSVRAIRPPWHGHTSSTINHPASVSRNTEDVCHQL